MVAMSRCALTTFRHTERRARLPIRGSSSRAGARSHSPRASDTLLVATEDIPEWSTVRGTSTMIAKIQR